MAKLSGFWTTNAAGSGDQVASYTQAQLSIADRIVAACSHFEGVAPGFENELECTDGGANTVSVDTGGAVVDGKWFHNDSSQNVTIDSAGAGLERIDRIVLRADWANFNVSVHKIEGSDASPGNAVAPSVTQTSETTYDIKLCQVLVDDAGDVTVTDEREWAIVTTDDSTLEDSAGTLRVKDSGITTAKINNSAVTAAKIANRTRSIFVPAVAAVIDGQVEQSDRVTPLGYITSNSSDFSIFGNLVVPKDYASGNITVKLLYYTEEVTSVSGNIRITTDVDYGGEGEAYDTHAEGGSYTNVAVTADTYDYHDTTVTSAAIGDVLKLRGRRQASNGGDTFTGGTVYFVGWNVEYTADS